LASSKHRYVYSLSLATFSLHLDHVAAGHRVAVLDRHALVAETLFLDLCPTAPITASPS